jgi:hypothetical protein
MTDTLHEEAARYALLRRVAPTLRHHMAGEFQPLGMMAALLERRVQKNELTGVQEQCAGLGQMSRQAAAHCMDLMNWVAPRGPHELALEDGLGQCVHLLATSLRFRGFALVHDSSDVRTQVAGPALRSVLPAALLYLSDSSPGPAQLRLIATQHATQVGVQPGRQQVQVRITLTPTERTSEPHQTADQTADYRALQWADVCALARAEAVELQRWPDGLALYFAAVA